MRKKNFALLFDLDGVLIDSRDLHYQALNLALMEEGPWLPITPKEQEATYEGLTTRDKLEILHRTKGLGRDRFDSVWRSKQEHTARLFEGLERDEELIAIFQRIKERGFKIGVVSNSIRDTLNVCLNGLGIREYIDLDLSNEEVLEVKPSPAGYEMAMRGLRADPLTTAIFEDSLVGRLAAVASGARLVPIENRETLTMELVEQTMNQLDAPVFNILIPMAGAGSRFAEAGYEKPKPMIEVKGYPMISQVVDSLNMKGNFIFLVQEKHSKDYELPIYLSKLCHHAPSVTVIELGGLTEGAASTTLLAEHSIDNDAPLAICNSDQIVEWDSRAFLKYAGENNLDGCIAIFESDEPRWSYAKTNDEGFVTEVAEKQVISNLATVGIYYWKHGSDYVKYAKKMIADNKRVNGEFYVCPVYNEAIADGLKIGVYKVDTMHGLGTPEDLEAYLNG